MIVSVSPAMLALRRSAISALTSASAVPLEEKPPLFFAEVCAIVAIERHSVLRRTSTLLFISNPLSEFQQNNVLTGELYIQEISRPAAASPLTNRSLGG